MLRDKFKGKPNVDIVKLHKSGGVVARSSKFRQRMRNVKTRVSLGIFDEVEISDICLKFLFIFGKCL
jgi:hypothetical protein